MAESNGWLPCEVWLLCVVAKTAQLQGLLGQLARRGCLRWDLQEILSYGIEQWSPLNWWLHLVKAYELAAVLLGPWGLLQGSTTPVPNDSVELLVLRQDCFKISHLGWQSSVTSYLPFWDAPSPRWLWQSPWAHSYIRIPIGGAPILTSFKLFWLLGCTLTLKFQSGNLKSSASVSCSWF